jgi:hypothetical protein
MSESGSPDASDALERRYRRLLAWYPAEHRRVHGEEMIGVLLASAGGGRRRPGLAESLDLIRGGLRIRLKPRMYDGIDAGWADTLAVASLAIPTMVAILYAAMSAWLTYNRIRSGGIVPLGPIVFLTAFLLLMALPPVLALCGRRRTAVPFYFVPLLWLGYNSIPVISGGYGGLFLAFLIAALAFVLSPGPRRAVQIMTARTWAVVCGIGLAMCAPEVIVRLPPPQWPLSAYKRYLVPYVPEYRIATVASLTLIAIGAAIGLLRTLPSPIGRRLLVLLAIAAYPGGAALGIPGAGVVPNGAIELVYMPTGIFAFVAASLVWKSRRQARPHPPQPAKD